MTLEAGTRLGPYEVLALLGAGGMGEVYRARDTRLSREVAIKVLPSELAADQERLKRFEKEARSASSLNHPSIVTIYEIGQADSVSYFVMELVEGRTLRELLLSGPLPIKKLLQIGTQVADGLARAHEAGIVHRDLKPENVMVTKDGLAKILDFGLAKLAYAGPGSGDETNRQTETATTPGIVMGTVAYMSPEQASGHAVDFRSDQFSFGSILYEMATGKRAFQGGTAVDTLSAILHEDPKPVAEINPEAPAPLRWVVERCLAKDPEDRYGTTKDLARELATLRDHLPEAANMSGPSLARDRRRRTRAIAAVVAAALLAALAVGVQAGRRIAKPSPPFFKRLTFQRGNVVTARFTGDGQTIVYGATWNGNPWRVFATRREGSESTSLPLPDSFFQGVSRSGELAITLVDSTRPQAMAIGGTLARIPISGGTPREVLDDVQLADWASDGSSLLVVRNMGGKSRLEFPIGKVLYETDGAIRYPRVSPGGDLAAFVDSPSAGDDAGSVAVVDREGKRRSWPPALPAPAALPGPETAGKSGSPRRGRGSPPRCTPCLCREASASCCALRLRWPSSTLPVTEAFSSKSTRGPCESPASPPAKTTKGTCPGLTTPSPATSLPTERALRSTSRVPASGTTIASTWGEPTARPRSVSSKGPAGRCLRTDCGSFPAWKARGANWFSCPRNRESPDRSLPMGSLLASRFSRTASASWSGARSPGMAYGSLLWISPEAGLDRSAPKASVSGDQSRFRRTASGFSPMVPTASSICTR
jgi:hypothetical protein